MKKYLPILFGSIVFGIDIFSKQWAQGLRAPLEFLGGFLRIELHKNPGIAFSLPVPNALQIFFSLVVLGGIGLFWKKIAQDSFENITLTVVLGGAMGNLLERVTEGRVTDFIAIGNFPVFNLADTALSCGICALLLHEWWRQRS